MAGMWNNIRWVSVVSTSITASIEIPFSGLDITPGVDSLIAVSWSTDNTDFISAMEVLQPYTDGSPGWERFEQNVNGAIIAITDVDGAAGVNLLSARPVGDWVSPPPNSRWSHTNQEVGDPIISLDVQLLVGEQFGI